MSKITYTDFVTLVDILESTTDANVEKPYFYFSHETLRKCHGTVTKRNTVFDYVQRTEYPDLMSWVNDSVAVMPATAGNPLQNLRFGDATAFLDLHEILEALEWTFEAPAPAAAAAEPAAAAAASSHPFIDAVLAFANRPKAASTGGAGAGAAAAVETKRFIPTRSKKVFAVLQKIDRGEALTEEEGEMELDNDDDSSYAPSEATEKEEDGMDDLTQKMEQCRVAVTEARKESDRLFRHMMSLATTHSAPLKVVGGVQKAYEQQKQRETAAAVQYVGAYLDARGFFGYADNVGRVLDKELGDYSHIAKAMLAE
jgi:hypothetical protein